MHNTIYTIQDIKNIIRPITDKYKVQSIYLFGSYARADATPESDLDF